MQQDRSEVEPRKLQAWSFAIREGLVLRKNDASNAFVAPPNDHSSKSVFRITNDGLEFIASISRLVWSDSET